MLLLHADFTDDSGISVGAANGRTEREKDRRKDLLTG